MNEETASRLPGWYWIVAAAALLWNVAGVAAFVADTTMSAEAIGRLPAAERALRESVPALATLAYAIAVFGGVVAALALLLRRALTVVLCAGSLVAVLLQMGTVFMATDALAVLGTSALIMPGAIIAIGIALLAFAVLGRQRGWLH